jgi:hypothetical protein
MHVKVRRQRHRLSRLQFRAVGYVVEAIAYVSGVFFIGAGGYLIMRGNFPEWWQRRLRWPLVRITPRVAHLQGVAAVAIGVSIIALVFTTAVPEVEGGILVMFALVAYLAGLVLYLFSTWLSRRPAA